MKQISENIWEFDPQIYPQLLWISVSPTTEETKELFLNTYTEKGEEEKDLEPNLKDSYAIVYHVRKKENKRTGSMIIFNGLENLNFGEVSHEVFHAVFNLCSVCDLTYNNFNHEHLAYYGGWIGQCCEKVKNEIENGNRTM